MGILIGMSALIKETPQVSSFVPPCVITKKTLPSVNQEGGSQGHQISPCLDAMELDCSASGK